MKQQGALNQQQQQQQQQRQAAHTAAAQPEAQWAPEPLPLVVFPRGGNALEDSAASLRACADRYLARFGSILYRGFHGYGSAEFQRFAEAFGASVTPLPAGSIWGEAGPGRLLLGNTAAAPVSADTLIADNREIYRTLSAALRTRLIQRGLHYARTFHERAGARWQDVFRTGDREQVEAWCRDRQIAFTWQPGKGDLPIAFAWLPGNTLRVECAAAVVTRHPRTGEPLWTAALPPAHPAWSAWGGDRESYEREADDTFELLYADGSPVEHSVIAEIVAAFTECASVVEWEPGDVLLLDRAVMCTRIPDARRRHLSFASGEPGASTDRRG